MTRRSLCWWTMCLFSDRTSLSLAPLLPEVWLGPPSGLPIWVHGNMLKLLKPLPHVSPFKPPFSEVMVIEKPFELAVICVDFCTGWYDVVVSLLVLFDVGEQSPVVEFSDGLSKCMVGCWQPNEHAMEPWGERGSRFGGTIVWFGINVGDPEEVVWSAVVSESRHPSISQLFNVLGGPWEAIVSWDSEVWNLSPIFLITF